MELLETSAVSFVQKLLHSYLVSRDIPAVLSALDDRITWIGTGKFEICHSIQNARELLFAERDDWGGRFSITRDWYKAVAFDSKIVIVYGEFSAEPDLPNSETSGIDTRFSVVLRVCGDSFRVLHLHHSVPNPEQTAGDYFSRSLAGFNDQDLREKIEEKVGELEQIYAQAHENEARYRLVLEATNDVIFEIDYEKLLIICNDSPLSVEIGLQPVYKITPEDPFPYQACIHPDDRENFYWTLSRQQISQMAAEDKRSLTFECRVLNSHKKYIWISVTIVPIENSRGQIVKLIGKVRDIDEQKKKLLSIEMQSMRDPLTGVYNKACTASLVDEYLAGEGKDLLGALFIIDIDDFKSINDNFGHLLGDAVLSDVAAKTQSLFRSDDIVGRIGGDEFLVFMKGLKDESVIQQKAQALTEIFRRTFTGRQSDYKISGSIGIAISPRDGSSYSMLFENADNALYRAKDGGKNQYALYDSQVDREYVYRERTQLEPPHSGHKLLRENISEYIFHILYEAKDLDSAVNMVLEIIGRYFGVSRVYILENSDDNQRTTNTFEWCNDGISPAMPMLQDIPIAPGYLDYFRPDGVFYCEDITRLSRAVRDVLDPQGIHAMLQCALKDEGAFKGFVGFDECGGQRFWTQEEVDTLAFIAKILSTFLIKLRTQARLRKSFQIAQSILDHLNTLAYVTAPGSYELLFLNRRLLELLPYARVGDLCYKALWNRQTPCEQCPMALMLRDQAGNYTREMYNPYLNKWVNATASHMPWLDGSNVALISCYDITRFRKA
ncbi:MAG: diguanylate cyclase domain-containing protein [Anaerotruncus rubiinfantis]|jgi:diguanylate cyclase (GGDEF)-like protein